MADLYGRKKYSCVYPSCKNSYFDLASVSDPQYRNKRFFKFPFKHPDVLDSWKQNCNINSNVSCKNLRICEDHFEPADFVYSPLNRLNHNATPKKFQIESNLDKLDSVNVNDNITTTTLDIYFDEPSTSGKKISSNKGPSTSPAMNIDDELLIPCPELSDTPNSDFDLDISDSVISDENIVMPTALIDHIYAKNEMSDVNRYSCLLYNKQGILGKSAFSKKEVTPKKRKIYKIHQNVTSKLSKLKSALDSERHKLKVLKELYEQGLFQYLEDNNDISKNFLKSQLRNTNRKPESKRCSAEDKAFALSIYNRSPELYRYLQSVFSLPSPRILKSVLAKIPFSSGMNKPILDLLKIEVDKMPELDRIITLSFDKISLSNDLYYQATEQNIFGYEDLGEVGRSHDLSNHALVFMIRGVRKSYKQVVAYYLSSDTIPSHKLKNLIVTVIGELQNIGFSVIATVCDQISTNQTALLALCDENKNNPTPYHFVVKNQLIYVIFDVPHLLKNTRNALMIYNIQFTGSKEAKFKYIKQAFDLDQQRIYKMLPKLKSSYFDETDSFMKMKVKVAASQLSHTVAAALETWVTLNKLPAEAIFAAEFIDSIDNLFDSLNGSQAIPPDGKIYRCALSKNSPHINFWNTMLNQMDHWRLLDKEDNKDKTNFFSFVKGWQTTIRSIIHIWHNLNSKGLQYLNLRAFNQDPIENLFGLLREHGIGNTNSNPHQFISALKTVVVNNLSAHPDNGNCENDHCQPLSNLTKFLSTDFSS